MSKRDYYDILGVSKTSSKDEIKKAYRKLALKYHPDRNPDDAEAEAKFKEASVAAEILLDEDKRRKYDQFGHAGVDGSGGGFGGGFEGFSGDFGDIFGDIFGDFFGGGGRGGRSRSRARGGRDLQLGIKVPFEEAAFGTEKTVSIHKNISCTDCSGSGVAKGKQPTTCDLCGGAGEVRRQQGFFTVSSSCPKCSGSGQIITDPCQKCHGHGVTKKNVELSVKVPAGIDVGQRLKLSNEGDAGAFGGPPGDLYILIDVEKHDFFTRDEFDVLCQVPISFSQAALGADVEVPTLEGKVSVKIPAGSQSGKKMRLKNKGITRLGGYGRGDQILSIQVETPTKLSSEQREVFEKLSKLEAESNSNPMSRGFFDKVKDLFQ